MSSNLANLLRKTNWLTEQQYGQIIASPLSSIDALLAIKPHQSEKLAQHLSDYFQLPYVNLAEFDYPAVCEQFALTAVWQRFRALPIQFDSKLTVAVADPTDTELEPELRFHTGLDIELVVADCQQLTAALQTLFSHQVQERATSYRFANTQAPDDESAPFQDDSISQYIEQILQQAAAQKASDIHFEPNQHGYRIRFRIDGLLSTITQVSPPLSLRLAGRVKILANLDIAERRLPQDGRTQLTFSPQSNLDIRVSTLPTVWGEKIVLRLLDQSLAALTIPELGLSKHQQSLFLNALNQPQGLILITGPTGSGKTVSLYSGLNHINRDSINIATAEDPVEILLDGVNQVEIKPQIGFDFAHALRAFLRQDPDVLMIGEIRDKETADIAVKAAQTGHLVLATLHTNSAAQSITRLMQMGIAPYNVSASLNLIIAQRLVRKLCLHCKVPSVPTAKLVEQLNRSHNITPFEANPQGCDHCHHGYSGRIGIYQVMKLDHSLAHAINQQQSAVKLEEIGRQNGSHSLYQAGLEKWAQGLTSHAELERVLLSE